METAMRWLQGLTISRVALRRAVWVAIAVALLPSLEARARLVAYWPADGDYADASGNGHHGTPWNAPSFTTGAVGSAFWFNGNLAQNVRVADHSDFHFGTGDFSVVFWARPNSNVGNGHGMIAKDSYGLDPTYRGWLINEADALGGLGVETRRFGVADTNARTPTRIPPGTWGHLAAVRSNGIVRLYRDGVLVASTTESTSTDVNTSAILTIGSLYPTPSPQYFSGALDEIAIFDHALGSSEIASIFKDGVLPTASMIAPTFFTSESEFVALADGTLALESFEAFAPGTEAPFTTASGVTVTHGPFADVSVNNSPGCATDGLVCIYYSGGFADASVTFSFAQPIQAFGIDVIDLGTNGQTTFSIATPSAGSQALFQDFTGAPGNLLFAGVVDPVGFSSVTISNSKFSDGVGLDRLRFGVAFDQCAPTPWLFYRQSTEEVAQYATLGALEAGSTCSGFQPIVPTRWDDLASDGDTWVLYDATTETISRFASLADLAQGKPIAGVEPIAPVGFDRIAADADTWVLYDWNTAEIARYATLADLIGGNDLYGREAIPSLPIAPTDLASDGSIWAAYYPIAGFYYGSISHYASIDDLIAGNAVSGAVAPIGYSAIGAAIAVPEPAVPLGIASGAGLLSLLGRRRRAKGRRALAHQNRYDQPTGSVQSTGT